jgi:hypothetical protein
MQPSDMRPERETSNVPWAAEMSLAALSVENIRRVGVSEFKLGRRRKFPY